MATPDFREGQFCPGRIESPENMKKLIILVFVIILNTSLNLHPCQVLKKILNLIILPYVYIIEVGLFEVWCFSLNFSKVI